MFELESVELENVELEIGTTDLHGQGFAYARPFGEWNLENAMRKFLKSPLIPNG